MNSTLDDNLNAAAETVVGPSVKIQGDLNSEGNIKIEGQVAGKVKTTQSVYVNEGAKISADIVAGNGVIGGEILGNLKISGHLVFQSTAKVTGDITCQILRVEDGAQFSGKCSMGSNGNGNGKKSPQAEVEGE
ncbi:MAG: polymer-forming cytoskeletal protein [Candidatus Doudnabacteria bacterium]|nr:polymer-forming cytoskeletal protein [Candidatus Doudnabacteria bacterium]